jgi:hypothetical protein
LGDVVSGEQFYQTVELQQVWQEEEAKRIERANEALAEINATRDEEFRREIEAKYPNLRSWL